MKLKDFIEELNQFDPELDIIFGDEENYPYSFSRADIGKLGVIECQWTINQMIFEEDENVVFDENPPVKNVVVIKIDGGVF